MAETLGALIKRERERLAMSQDALAQLLEVTQQAVQSWEMDKSRPKRDRLEKLFEVFGANSDFSRMVKTISPWISDWSQPVRVIVTGGVKSSSQVYAADHDFDIEIPSRHTAGRSVALQIEKSFFDALPEELRQYAARPNRGYYDYASAKLVAELVSAVSPANLSTRVAPSMVRLAVIRSNLDRTFPNRRYILFLVSPEGRSPLVGLGLQQVMADALALRIEVALVSGGVEAAGIVAEIEGVAPEPPAIQS